MFRPFLALSFAVGLLANAPSFAGQPPKAADETYTLKFYQSKKGDKTTHEMTKNSKASASAAGRRNNKETSAKEAYTEEILEKKDGEAATKLTRTYTYAEKTVNGEGRGAVYAGKTVLIEKKGDRYEFSIGGKGLEEREAPELFDTFNKDAGPQNEDFLPAKPLKVGQSWKLPSDKSERIVKSLDNNTTKIDAKKSTVGGKLLKVYKKNGAQFGVLELNVTMFITEFNLDGQFVKTTADSKIIMKSTVDTCIDGTVAFEVSRNDVTLDITAEQPEQGSVTIKATITGVEEMRAAKK